MDSRWRTPKLGPGVARREAFLGVLEWWGGGPESYVTLCDSGADWLYVCMKAHLFSLSKDLQHFVFEGTNIPKEPKVLANVNILHNNQILDPEAVSAFKSACEIYSSAEKN